MECQATNILLQDFIDGKLADADAESVSDHHKECFACARQYRDTLAVIELLKDVHVPPPSPGFSTRVIKQATKTPDTTFVSGGIAASLAVLLVLASILFKPVFEDQGMPVVLMDGEVITIKVAIDSVRSIDSVKMNIDISDNLEFTGYEGQKKLSWNTRLNRGTNIIALPISAIELGDGEITTRVRSNGSERIFVIKTRYQSPEKAGRGYRTIVNARLGNNPRVSL